MVGQTPQVARAHQPPRQCPRPQFRGCLKKNLTSARMNSAQMSGIADENSLASLRVRAFSSPGFILSPRDPGSFGVPDQLKYDVKALREKAGPFPPEAFEFVRRGLQHTVDVLHGSPDPTSVQDESRHVTGQQLCLGLRDFAVRQYGLLARTV